MSSGGRVDSYIPGKGIDDVDRKRARERERQEHIRQEEREEENEKGDNKNDKTDYDPVAEYKRLMELRSGGRYVPPAKLRAVQQAMEASQSPKDYQRVQWEKLKKSINRLINQVNIGNIREIVQSVFEQNLIRGRGLLVRGIMRAQAASLSYTNVFAALVAIINSKLPQIGELLVTRLVIQFRKAFKRNNKATCISCSLFLAHLCNQQVAHEVLCLQMLHLLLEKPTNDSVEIAVGFMRQVGAYLSEISPAAATGVFERFRTILHQGELETRVQYMIEVLFQVRKEGYQDNPIVKEDLDLVEEDDQITHMIGLDDEGLKAEEGLNVFRFDENYEENEGKYNKIKEEILNGDDDDDEDESSSDDDEEEEADDKETDEKKEQGEKVVIKDMTNTELVNLRKTIYLTIMSTMSTQEITHKLLKIDIPDEQKMEIVNMLIEACSQEKIYNKIYGGVGSQLCLLNAYWKDRFVTAFKDYYGKIHRYDGNKIRNIATMFGFMLASDSLSWKVFEEVYISEEHTNPSSRIFIKYLFQEMQQEVGINELKTRFSQEFIQPYINNLFPKTTREETMFAINFFTVLKLGPLTDGMREYLEKLPPPKKDEGERRGRSRSRSSSYDSKSVSGSRSRSYSSSGGSRSTRSSRSMSSRSRSNDDRGRGRRGYSESRSRSPSQSGGSRSSSSDRSKSTDSRQPRRSRRYSSQSVSSPKRDQDDKTNDKGKENQPDRDYTPPPQRPTSWNEVKRGRSNSPQKEEEVKDRDSSVSRNVKRPKAADYL